jgi:hypothetical protein
MFNLVYAIDRFLRQAHCVAGTAAMNGNRWSVPALPNGQIPPYPIAPFSESGVPGRDERMRLPTRLAYPCVMSLSLQLAPSVRLAPRHPLRIATRSAARVMPVVVAAGNWFREPGENTMSALARLPWVISVGGTDSSLSGDLIPSSSGGKATEPASGPTVVAYAENPFAAQEGTSFAAPRVARQVITLTGFALTLRHYAERMTGDHRGIPLLAYFSADFGGREEDRKRTLSLPALPPAGIDEDGLARSLELLDQQLLPYRFPSPRQIRHMLLRSAYRMPGYGRHEAGTGFVADVTTRAYVRNFTGYELGLVLGRTGGMSREHKDELKALRLADSDTVDVLTHVWRQSLLRWLIDLSDNVHRATSPCVDPASFGDAVEQVPVPWAARSTG